MSELSLTPSQLNAIGFSGSDLLVSAGAGSGKTATLTKRIVKKITENHEDISRKLIVTFTKDASNELRTRINSALAEALKIQPSNKHICDQIVKLGSADICTIDSFCLKLVRANFEQVGLDGNFRIAEESESEVLCQEAISEVIDRFYDERGDDVDFLRVCDCFSSFSSEEKLKKDLLGLYKKLITTKDSLETLVKGSTLEGDFMDTPYGKVLREHLISFCDYYIGFFDYAISLIGDDEDAINGFLGAFESDRAFAIRLKGVAELSYSEIAELLASYSPKKLGNTKRIATLDVDFFKGMRDKFKERIRDTFKKDLFSSSKEILRSSFEKNASVCSSLYDILLEFDKEYTKKKRSAGVCDFNDVSRYALALLYDKDGNPSAISRDIALSYDEIYIDEYQDTNFVQDKIFRAIASNNRFMVGDIKQSIYRFRSAEPEIFSSYRMAFSPELDASDGGKSIFMSENFRCDSSVIEFSNTVSDFIFKKSSGIPYSDEDRLKFAKVNASYTPDKAEIYIVDKTKDDEVEEEELLSREAEFVADKIKDLIDNEYLANGKKIMPSDIAILLRGFKKPVELYVNALTKRGIECEYRGDEHFFEKTEVLLALCVLNAIDNPLRDVYLAGAMRSDVFGFSLEEMVKIREASRDASSFYDATRQYKGDASLERKIKDFLERLKKYREECRKRNSYEIISLVLSDTSLLGMASEGERKNLLKLYDLARAYEGGKYKGLYGFLRYVEGIKESSGKEDLGSTDGNGVKIMSVHASKGLEFEVCFVCACGSKMNAQDASDPILYHRDLGISAYVSRDKGIARFNTLLRKCTALAIKRSSAEEEMRMLYVAMTRARSRLILTAGLSKSQEFISSCDKLRHFAGEYSVLSPRCYMEWVLQAVFENPACAIFHPPIMEGSHTEPAVLASETEPQAQISPSRRESVDSIKDTLRQRFDFVYPYEHLNKLPSKLTVSRLYPEILDEGENKEVELKELPEAPSFILSSDRHASASDKGTATHIFMQFCDLNALRDNGARAELDRLTRERYISSDTSELVSLNHIDAFVKSDLFDELLRARKILREFRFNVMLDASELSQDERLSGERVLVQGVTDCIFENESGELILVDYKTDSVTEKNYVELLTSRHKSQLSYYKRAVELMFEKPVARTLIYSVPLAKVVEIK